MDKIQLNRWRVLLGEEETDGCEARGLSGVLNFVYGNDDARRDRYAGGKGATALTVPEWIREAKALLPEAGFDVLVKHAIGKYNLSYLLEEDEVLDRIRPDIDILREILTFKSALGERTQKLKRLVRTIADELSEKMKREVAPALYGARRSFRRGYARRLRNLNIRATIRRNLKTYDPQRKRLYPQRLIFYADENKRTVKRLILLVDESGSMVDSVINTAVLAGILSKTKFLDMSVAVFDTSIVDLTDICGDVTELLLSVQLGGGTDIGAALLYAQEKIVDPRQTVIVLISDLCDGFGYRAMYAAAKAIVQSGAKLLCLTAMDHGEGAAYSEQAAGVLSSIGASVAAKTPKELCDWIINETK